ncbi:Gfo/Idh/MocA family oxidoreductase [Mesorhizobium sp. LHD-90]|uniref:Gfo/Idh/MocA family protein n=1 Tax=Mesorhizobium sp. LHD-90 TaxID=3071414 RepID=UPI0027E07F3F|nr:Gfo/Idh/MocA family oxidoreductase [Mesorhizobium sp. LHD-90]MDQ6433795.1 Gfo/Idh/MocA family oxidoreductase [Mesorhizobium sp. LHD-90]
MSGTPSEDSYALAVRVVETVAAPDLDYKPPRPKSYQPRIALVGAGGISFAHLDAYRKAGYEVPVICSRTLSKAVARREEFFPQAEATDDFSTLLSRDDIDILDITTHPKERETMIGQALDAGKHVLSQKPFVLDLDTGKRLADLAEANGLKLAVNQNGRWAPHFSYMREAVREGLIGEVMSCHVGVHWNHGWIKGTPFEEIDDLVFYDFAIHWFDFLASIIGDRASSVFATRASAAGQEARPPLLAQSLVAFGGGQASLIFDGAAPHGPQDRTYIAGTKGSLFSIGPNLGQQTVEITTEAGVATPALEGTWFNDGFHGAMGELICAIEENREPLNGARGNLVSLAMAFAAIASAHSGVAVAPGSVTSLAAAQRAGSH